MTYPQIVQALKHVHQSSQELSTYQLHCLENSLSSSSLVSAFYNRFNPINSSLSRLIQHAVNRERVDQQRLRTPGIFDTNVHSDLFGGCRNATKKWLERHYGPEAFSEEHHKNALERVRCQINNKEFTHFLLQEEQNRFQERARKGLASHMASEQEILSDLNDYLSYLQEHTGPVSKKILLGIQKHIDTESDPQKKQELWWGLVRAIDDSRTAYHDSFNKFISGHDYSCPIGYEERLLDAWFCHLPSSIAIISEKHEQVIDALTKPFIFEDHLMRYGSDFLYSLYCDAAGYTIGQEQDHLWAIKPEIAPELYQQVARQWRQSLKPIELRRLQAEFKRDYTRLNPGPEPIDYSILQQWIEDHGCWEKAFEKYLGMICLSADSPLKQRDIALGIDQLLFKKKKNNWVLKASAESPAYQSAYLRWKDLLLEIEKCEYLADFKAEYLVSHQNHQPFDDSDFKDWVLHQQCWEKTFERYMKRLCDAGSTLKHRDLEAGLAVLLEEKMLPSLQPPLVRPSQEKIAQGMLASGYFLSKEHLDYVLSLLRENIDELEMRAESGEIPSSYRPDIDMVSMRNIVDTYSINEKDWFIGVFSQRSQRALWNSIQNSERFPCSDDTFLSLLEHTTLNIDSQFAVDLIKMSSFLGYKKSLGYLLALQNDQQDRQYYLAISLYYATYANHYECAQELIHLGADPHYEFEVNADEDGIFQTALLNNAAETLKVLIASGMNIRATKKTNALPIFFTESLEHPGRCIRTMAKAGGDLNIIDKDGNTLLMYALNHGIAAVYEQLLPLHIDVNILNKKGNSALMMAIPLGDRAVVKKIIDCGADLNILNHQDQNPLSIAILFNDTETLELLIEHGADTNFIYKSGCTPVMLSIQRHKFQSFEKLLQSGSDINIKNAEGKTALMLALEQEEHPDYLNLLLEQKNIAIDAQDNHGMTALMHAMMNNNTRQIRKLIESGADIHLTEQSGCNALELAIRHAPDCLPLIIKAGANLLEQRSPIAQDLVRLCADYPSMILNDKTSAYCSHLYFRTGMYFQSLQYFIKSFYTTNQDLSIIKKFFESSLQSLPCTTIEFIHFIEHHPDFFKKINDMGEKNIGRIIKVVEQYEDLRERKTWVNLKQQLINQMNQYANLSGLPAECHVNLDIESQSLNNNLFKSRAEDAKVISNPKRRY